jgi:hypothetical protein
MQNRLSRLLNLAAVVMLASACSGDNTTAPLPVDGSANVPLSSAIKLDIATTAGNAIASDIESLIASQVSAVGPFAVADHPESCSFNAAGQIYSCTKSGDGKSVVKSYQFLDASGNPMDKFVKGTTEAIHYLMKTDAIESRDNNKSVIHSLRDATVSGFLGPNRIWNGFGSSADTTVHKEDLSTRTYTGLSVDTVKAVTFVEERALHPYPLSGVAVRVVDYTVVSTGKQLETTTVHRRAVVTFNGTADVPISLGDYSCVLHLDTHKVDGCK